MVYKGLYSVASNSQKQQKKNDTEQSNYDKELLNLLVQSNYKRVETKKTTSRGQRRTPLESATPMSSDRIRSRRPTPPPQPTHKKSPIRYMPRRRRACQPPYFNDTRAWECEDHRLRCCTPHQITPPRQEFPHRHGMNSHSP